ncbi:MAG: hypothetical protein ACMUEL_01935 [Flavobacteriales bacterium Tduv]
MKRWFGSGKDRYKGLAHVHAQSLMETISIICIVCLKLLHTISKNKYD